MVLASDLQLSAAIHSAELHQLKSWCAMTLVSAFPATAAMSSLPADIPDCGDSLCLAVLYYVAPDSGFTLDILQWAPGSVNLSVKLRLQLHELAEMHSFLLGCLVLDMSTIPTCESGDWLQAAGCVLQVLTVLLQSLYAQISWRGMIWYFLACSSCHTAFTLASHMLAALMT